MSVPTVLPSLAECAGCQARRKSLTTALTLDLEPV